MDYAIHLFAPKTGRLTPSMLEWLIHHAADTTQPEAHFPVRKLKPYALARILLKLDPSLIPEQVDGGNVILHYPIRDLGIRLMIHDRGLVVLLPIAASTLARIMLGISYTYIRYLFEEGGFWSFDPQLNVISYADDYQSIDEAAEFMEQLLPKLLNG